ncbi:Uncharacterised protein [Mycobacterium tuberculosis]|uniref:Uncharacterized protein n=1 Tax=Mycobacterium tuberculosis TaxID=1773 RepID=A0A654TW99_MYCTX|nr:Uncharacterised protein [Mycobacterium tuberculosis]
MRSGQRGRDLRGLCRGQYAHHIARDRVRPQRRDDDILVDVRGDDQRLNAGITKDFEPARGGGPEHQPGHRRMCVISCSVMRCQLKTGYRNWSTGSPHRVGSGCAGGVEPLILPSTAINAASS